MTYMSPNVICFIVYVINVANNNYKFILYILTNQDMSLNQ